MSLRYPAVNAMDPKPAPQRDQRFIMPSKRNQSHASMLCLMRVCGWVAAVAFITLLPGCQSGGGSYVPSEAATPSNTVYRLRVGDVVLLEVFQEPYMLSLIHI